MKYSLVKRNPKKILFIIGSLEIGGTEKQLIELIKKLKCHDYFCNIFSLQSGGELLQVLKNISIPIYSANLIKGDIQKAPWKIFIAQWKIYKTIKNIKPDVIHSYLPLVTFMGAIAGRFSSVPLVITSKRALGTHQERYSILKLLDYIANLLSHRITVNSMAVWNDVVKRDHIDPTKLVLIYNAVNPIPFEDALPSRDQFRQELNVGKNSILIISIGNLISYKGHSDLIKTASLVLRKFPESRYILIGEDRGIQKDLERQAKALGVSEYIIFMGKRDDIPSLLAASDISVLASYEEGFSNAILESMAAGLPVIATRVGGNSEAVIDKVTGRLVPPRDPEKMADAIMELCESPQKRKIWGKEGKNRIKTNFTLDQMVEKHLMLYRKDRCCLFKKGMHRN